MKLKILMLAATCLFVLWLTGPVSAQQAAGTLTTAHAYDQGLSVSTGDGSITQQGANKADTAWMVVATGLAMVMTPGIAFFYGGLTRSKNVLNTVMMSFVALAIVSIQWMLWGYSVAFGPVDLLKFGGHGVCASPLGFMGLNHVGATPNAQFGPTIPQTVFMLFQMSFAVIAPALMSGAVVERMRFGAYCVFIVLWTSLLYDPLAHMVWGGGVIENSLHALDFAGGTVVLISAGVSALTLSFLLGKRKGHGGEELRPHNVPFVLLGVALLWVGWFGFNGGSELAIDGVAATAVVNTHLATAAAAFSWLMIEWYRFKRPTAIGFGTGAVAGLAAITPACGYVTAFDAVVIGLLAAPACFFMISLKNRLNRYDDSLDAFGVFAVGAIWGMVATGLFANSHVNAMVNATGAANGLFDHGGVTQLARQLAAIVATVVLSIVATWIIAKATGAVCGGLRATAEEEQNGLDVTEHGEDAYGPDSGSFHFYSKAG